MHFLQYQTVSLIFRYSSSDISPHFTWYQFKQHSHSTPFDLYVTFLLNSGYIPWRSFSGENISGISLDSAVSYCFSQRFAKMTARDAPIAKPSFWTYHISLHLKWTWLTAMFNSLFMVFLAIDGGSSCSYSFLRAMSIASFSGTFVHKLFTSRDIKFSLGSRLVLSKIYLASSELVSMFAPSIFSKNLAWTLFKL